MTFPEGLIKKPRTIDVYTNAMDAARTMESWNIGSLIVTEEQRPVGVVTDRDIALTVLGKELDPEACGIRDCMNSDVVSLQETAGTSEAIDLMCRNGIRRLPVVDDAGRLVGIVASDDLVLNLAHELTELASVIRTEISQRSSKGSSIPSRLGRE